jgi:hypothetical protein
MPRNITRPELLAKVKEIAEIARGDQRGHEHEPHPSRMTWKDCLNAKVTEVASSHVPMLSQPRRVYEVIRDAAVNIQRLPRIIGFVWRSSSQAIYEYTP